MLHLGTCGVRGPTEIPDEPDADHSNFGRGELGEEVRYLGPGNSRAPYRFTPYTYELAPSNYPHGLPAASTVSPTM